MTLQDKYKELIDAAKTAGVSNLQVREQNNVLYIDGTTNSGAVKDNLWNIYNKIDPDYRSGDLVLNIDASAAAGTKAKVTTQSSNLNIRKGPGTDQEIVGKAAHGEVVNVISKADDQWSLIRTDSGIEGYAYSQYLTQA
ncbi:SH3 domain-containing protein [Ilyomonas limi]|uniref:SH3 domain-containing protein n=1 Tax=Ilyomonas limi TaxID=2575867 RepID=A0A4U3L0U8_9BACT|nr:SH3 domain-containing protein [Ilyomonas limi]TKK68595.1 SH3 domain-containing protein [Ilyomonas limi]